MILLRLGFVGFSDDFTFLVSTAICLQTGVGVSKGMPNVVGG